MVKILIDNDGDKEEIQNLLSKSFQSGNINFLLGSGASLPAISVAGNVENEIQALFDENQDADANKKICEFLKTVLEPTNDLINGAENESVKSSQEQYKKFIENIELILLERKTDILPKQVSIYTTNYDLFVEDAVSKIPSIILNDGFERAANLDNKAVFSSNRYFDTTYHTGTLYNYTAEIPSINLLKIHGSLSWEKSEEEVIYSISSKKPLPNDDIKEEEKVADFIKEYALILPHKGKFHETLMGRIYYDLFRIYANELDKENSLLISFGFSFVDEHIYEITKRALKNPALKLVMFAFDDADKENFCHKFESYNNVTIISPEGDGNIDFNKFNSIIEESIPDRKDS